ncbi:hypothetical protein MASR2M78_04490 [Treponema sp.]
MRSTLISSLEAELSRAMRDSGGLVRMEGPVLTGIFDDERIAFWHDLVTALEGIAQAIENTGNELFGRACLVSRKAISPQEREVLLRLLSHAASPTGIWCEAELASILLPYAKFNPEHIGTHFHMLCSFINPIVEHKSIALPAFERIKEELALLLEPKKASHCIVIVGKAFIGKRTAIQSEYKRILGSFPPLRIRFGLGSRNSACFADAFTEELLILINTAEGKERALVEEAIDFLRFLRLDRHRSQFPPSIIQETKRVITHLVRLYAELAQKMKLPALIVIENIERASETAASLASDIFGPLVKEGLLSLCISASEAAYIQAWRVYNPSLVQVEIPNYERLYPKQAQFLTDDLKEMAYALHLLRPLFISTDIASQFTIEGKSSNSYKKALDNLLTLGLIRSLEDPDSLIPEEIPTIAASLGDKAERVRAMVRRRLLAETLTGKLQVSFGFLEALASIGGDAGDELALDAIEREINEGTASCLHTSIQEGQFANIVGTTRAEALSYIVSSRTALVQGSEEEINHVFTLPEPSSYPSTRYRAGVYSDQASYHLGANALALAAKKAKESILLLQDSLGSRGLARAYRLLGLIELSQDRVSDAIDYFNFASENAERSGNEYESMMIASCAASAHYVWGNLSRAERFAVEAEKFALIGRKAEWERWALFFRARILFETGRYTEAFDLFKVYSKNDESLEISLAEQRVWQEWAARAKSYSGSELGDFQEATGLEDWGLFHIEALFFARKYQAAYDLACAQLEQKIPSQFYSLERPDWQSGFSFAEDKIFPKHRTRRRLLFTFKALALSSLSHERFMSKNVEQCEEAIEIMRAIVKNEHLSDSDPNDSFYYQAYYQILERSGAPALDVGTILSIAFKRMQRRAGRIDDTVTKRAYLNLNRWNKVLLADAKKHNLI